MTKEDLDKLFVEQWDSARNFLKGLYPIKDHECDDAFIEAIEVLYEKSRSESFVLTSSLKSLFFGICKNKAREILRKRIPINEKESEKLGIGIFDEGKADTILSLESATTIDIQDFLMHLPKPCNKLLWGFYCDGFSLKELALQLATPYDVARHMISACRKKFRENYPH